MLTGESTLIVVALLLLSAAHLTIARTQLFDLGSKRWKSAAGGVGVAYVFLVLLPKIAEIQAKLVGDASMSDDLYGYLLHHCYLFALVGLVAHYGLDVAVERLLVSPARRVWQPMVNGLVLLHSFGMAGYFFLVGYLVGASADGPAPFVVVFTIAMVIHFLAMGHGLRGKYGGFFDTYLQWVFAAATALGGVTAMTTEIAYGTYAILNSLFAGMLLIATVKEKVPGTADAQFGPFLAGATGFSILLLVAERYAM